MNPAVWKLLKNKGRVGAEASVAATVGCDACATDAAMKAEILSYSRTQGLFATGSISRRRRWPDEEDNVDLYGKDNGKRCGDETMQLPPAVTELVQAR
jgi:lipid-binding SYLF domain-containing protein